MTSKEIQDLIEHGAFTPNEDKFYHDSGDVYEVIYDYDNIILELVLISKYKG